MEHRWHTDDRDVNEQQQCTESLGLSTCGNLAHRRQVSQEAIDLAAAHFGRMAPLAGKVTMEVE
jgi:hypothetical protein